MARHTPATRLSRLRRLVATLAIIFGAMTLVSGGAVLFGPEQARDMAGRYIDFVVWFNFIAGGFYILAGVGVWLDQMWAARLATFIAVATTLTALGFAIVVFQGHPFEMRTVGALAFRAAFWVVAAMVARVRP